MANVTPFVMQEEPYLAFKRAEKGENLTGNDMFEGFCKDMADEIAKSMNIQCMSNIG